MPTPAGAVEVHLNGVAAISAGDVWAVGSWAVAGARQTPYGNAYSTLIEHWDGSAWNIVPSPRTGATARLFSVAALSATNLWAVGYSGPLAGYEHTLVLHWDGKTWHRVGSPRPAFKSRRYPHVDQSELDGIAAVSTRNVWAVGSYLGLRYGWLQGRTLTLHWNGREWKRIPSANVANGDWLAAAAVAGKNVWAVGGFRRDRGGRPLAEHWNGRSWQIVSARSGFADSDYQALNGLAPVARDGIWAVGAHSLHGDGKTLSEHWNGGAWSVVPNPNLGSYLDDSFAAVAAASPKAVWAVGAYYPSQP